MGARTTAPRHALIPTTLRAIRSLGGRLSTSPDRSLKTTPIAAPKKSVGEKMPPTPPQAYTAVVAANLVIKRIVACEPVIPPFSILSRSPYPRPKTPILAIPKKTAIPRTQLISAPIVPFRKGGTRLLRLILARQASVPFWKPTPASAASPAVGITNRYGMLEMVETGGMTNAGFSPKAAWHTKVAVADAIRT